MSPFTEVRLRFRWCPGVPRPVSIMCSDAGQVVHLCYLVCAADRVKATTAILTFRGVRECRWLVVDTSLMKFSGVKRLSDGLYRREAAGLTQFIAIFHNEAFEIRADRHRTQPESGDLAIDAASLISAFDCDLKSDRDQ
jgi:hypothetical protein